MPRANRYFLPDHIWHITHRYRRNFVQDVQVVQSPGSSPGSVQNVQSRNSEAKKRFGLCVFDYVMTSNHIHLLVKDMYSCAVRPASSKGFKRSRVPIILLVFRTARAFKTLPIAMSRALSPV
jgi:hypothetical protein